MSKTAQTVVGMGLACGLVVVSGCNRDVRLAGRKLRNVTVRDVSHYGVTLEKAASPRQVAFVALRAVREDFLAANDAEREAALDKQFDVCAADVINARNLTGMNRSEFIHNVVYRWTPTVSHYVHEFETSWERAEERLVVRDKGPAKEPVEEAVKCEVAMRVSDPNGNPKAGVVLLVWLARDNGYWRVVHMGFDPTRRSIKRVTSTGPARATDQADGDGTKPG